MRSAGWRLAVAVAVISVLGAGCGGGGSPSGQNASGSGTTTGGGTTGGTTTGGGTTGGTQVRMIGWELSEILPGVTQPETWLFVATNGQTLTNVQVTNTQTGTQISIAAQAVLGNNTGLWIDLFPSPAQGTPLRVTAQTSTGASVVTNTLTYATGASPNSFTADEPADLDVVPQNNVVFRFSPRPNFPSNASFHILGLDLNANGFDFMTSVEITPIGTTQQSFTAGSSTTNTRAAFLNLGSYPPHATPFAPLGTNVNADTYAWNVVELDSTGWGVGTTVDVVSYPNGASVATWPFFDTN